MSAVFLCTLLQRVVPANAGIHHPWPQKGKKASAPAPKTRVRAVWVPALAGRRAESLRRTTQFKSSGIALHGLGHDKPVALGWRLTQPPADLGGNALEELGVVGALRRLPDALVEAVGVVADQDAPAPGLDAVEDDLCRRRRGHGSLVAKGPGTIGRNLLNVLIRHRRRVDAHALETLAGHRDFDLAQALGFATALDLAGIGNDRGADMAGHHHGAFDVRRVETEIVDQRFGESLHREFGGAIGGVRYARPDGGPEPVDAGGVDDMALVGFQQQRQKGSDAEINAAPADVEGLFPLLARVGEQAAAAADAGVVEQQMDLVGRLLLGELITEAQQLILNRDVGDMRGDAQALRQLFHLAKPLGFRHRSCRDIAHRDIAALGDELARELAAHARAAPGDNGGLSGKILHAAPSFTILSAIFLGLHEERTGLAKCSIYTSPVKLVPQWRDKQRDVRDTEKAGRRSIRPPQSVCRSTHPTPPAPS